MAVLQLGKLPFTIFAAAAGFLRQTIDYYLEHKVTSLAAALAFYTTFSLAPALLIALAVAELVVGNPSPESELARVMRQYVGDQATSFALSVMSTSRQHVTGGTATVIGVGTAVLGATVVFMELQSALNAIWEVKHEDGSGFLRLIYARVISFFLVVGAGLLLVVSLVLSAIISGLEQFLSQFISSYPSFLKTPNLVISFGILPVLLAMIYRLLPDARVLWRDVWLGAVVAALLFAIGKYAFGLYLGTTSLLSVYGAAGSFVIILVWVYYSAQVVLLGAELTRVYAERYGSRCDANVADANGADETVSEECE